MLSWHLHVSRRGNLLNILRWREGLLVHNRLNRLWGKRMHRTMRRKMERRRWRGIRGSLQSGERGLTKYRINRISEP